MRRAKRTVLGGERERLASGSASRHRGRIPVVHAFAGCLQQHPSANAVLWTTAQGWPAKGASEMGRSAYWGTPAAKAVARGFADSKFLIPPSKFFGKYFSAPEISKVKRVGSNPAALAVLIFSPRRGWEWGAPESPDRVPSFFCSMRRQTIASTTASIAGRGPTR
jgi:hypothetical protein